MTNTSMTLTSSTSKYLIKILENVQMKDRDSTWNQIYRDVKRATDIWSKIDKERKLDFELTKNRPKSSLNTKS